VVATNSLISGGAVGRGSSTASRHDQIRQKRAFCPYLTIEFKDEETLATARHQVAVASAMALYNRCHLKSALQMSRGKWSEKDMNQMRHYDITFTGLTRDCAEDF
jgi:hypothetical protein